MRIVLPFIIGVGVDVAVEISFILFELIRFTIGMSPPIAYTITMFIGGVIARMLEKKGPEWFREYIAVIAAGFGLGEGLMIAVAMASDWYRSASGY